MASALTDATERILTALLEPGFVVEERDGASFSVRTALDREDPHLEVEVWLEGDWVRLQCAVVPAADVRDPGLLALSRLNQRLRRVRAAMTDGGSVVVRADYPVFAWDLDDFRSVLHDVFASVDDVRRVAGQ